MNPTPEAAPLREAQAFELGVEAWTYLLPLVLMELTRRVMSNVSAPDSHTLRSPMGSFAHAARFPDASFRDVVRPNADTLYSMLWYDVGDQPLLLETPESPDRYHVLPLMDMWTDVFATLGSIATGGRGGRWAIVGPRWEGSLPSGVRALQSPTDAGWLLGRVQTHGPGDFEQVGRIQSQMRVLSASTPTQPDPGIDMVTPPVEQAMKMPAAHFFALAAELMKRNPPHASDGAQVLRLERLGLRVGQSFSWADAPADIQHALARAIPEAQRRLVEGGMRRRIHRDGWVLPTILGVYGNEYLSRALTAYRGLGALPPSEALYPTALSDREGRALDGQHRYRLHFERDQIPPVDAFWSLTMYGADHFFVPNPIDRFAIGDRDALSFNADGSLDLHIQHAPPAAEQMSNWLPAPAAPFNMNLRLYAPRPEALDGRWQPPGIERLS